MKAVQYLYWRWLQRSFPGVVTADQHAKMHPKTMENLSTAMHGEDFAYIKYTIFAEHARKDGNPEVADLFEKTAKIEHMEHLREHAELAGIVGSNQETSKDAIKGESYETETMYPTFAKEARAAGDLAAADRFEEIGKDQPGTAMRSIWRYLNSKRNMNQPLASRQRTAMQECPGKEVDRRKSANPIVDLEVLPASLNFARFSIALNKSSDCGRITSSRIGWYATNVSVAATRFTGASRSSNSSSQCAQRSPRHSPSSRIFMHHQHAAGLADGFAMVSES